MSFFSDREGSSALIPAIILWGCFGGICFTAVTYCLYAISRFFTGSCYFDIIFPFHTPWIFGTAIILSLVLGMIAADLFCTGRKISPGPILTGLLSGLCTALVGYMLVDVFHLLGFTWVWPNGPLDVIRGFLGWDTPAMYIIILTIPQVIGAWYQGIHERSGSDKNDTAHPARTGIKYRPWFLLVALFVVLLVIPLPLYVLPVDETKYSADGSTCRSGDQCGTGKLPDNVTVSRTSPDSIRLNLKASSTCGSHNSFKILLNGKDVSNEELITKSGLDVAITPGEGLGSRDGASVILQGRDVQANKTPPPHIQVMVVKPGGDTPQVLRDQYL